MKYAGIIYNDFSAAPGACLTFFTQGCPSPHCKGCHNPETWDFNGGKEFTQVTVNSIIKGLSANGIKRSFCVMGGEPLCKENIWAVRCLLREVKEECPDTKIYIWTRYTYEQLLKVNSNDIREIFSMADFLIDGPYIEEKRDITLPMRGSRNQRIINLKTGEIIND